MDDEQARQGLMKTLEELIAEWKRLQRRRAPKQYPVQFTIPKKQ